MSDEKGNYITKSYIQEVMKTARKFPGNIYWDKDEINGKDRIVCNDGQFIKTIFNVEQIIALKMVLDRYMNKENN